MPAVVGALAGAVPPRATDPMPCLSACRLLVPLVLLLLAACWPAATGAMDLYTGEALVASQDSAERERAVGPALAQVLVKVSGDPRVGQHPGIDAELAQAAALMLRFGYRQEPTSVAGQASNRLWLQAEFDRAGVDALLARAGVAQWGTERPLTLVWLVIDDGRAKTIASASQVAALGALTGAAQQRGIQVQLPAVDSEDLSRIGPEELWSGGGEKAYAAAQRYGARAALVARLAHSGTGWTGRFTLVDSGGSSDWSASYLDSSSVLAAGANGLADRLAQRFSIAPGDRVVADHHVVVEGVDGPSDYGRVLDYLGGMTAVGAVFPEGAEGDRLLLKLTLNVGLTRFGQMLALGDVLEMDAIADAAADPDHGAPTRLRVRR
jgi:hypothetical protein